MDEKLSSVTCLEQVIGDDMAEIQFPRTSHCRVAGFSLPLFDKAGTRGGSTLPKVLHSSFHFPCAWKARRARSEAMIDPGSVLFPLKQSEKGNAAITLSLRTRGPKGMFTS